MPIRGARLLKFPYCSHVHSLVIQCAHICQFSLLYMNSTLASGALLFWRGTQSGCRQRFFSIYVWMFGLLGPRHASLFSLYSPWSASFTQLSLLLFIPLWNIKTKLLARVSILYLTLFHLVFFLHMCALDYFAFRHKSTPVRLHN